MTDTVRLDRRLCRYEGEAVALSADGKTALMGSLDATTRLWGTATGKPIGPPLQHQDRIYAVALSADGKTALTGSSDQTARVWQAATGKPLGSVTARPLEKYDGDPVDPRLRAAIDKARGLIWALAPNDGPEAMRLAIDEARKATAKGLHRDPFGLGDSVNNRWVGRCSRQKASLRDADKLGHRGNPTFGLPGGA